MMVFNILFIVPETLKLRAAGKKKKRLQSAKKPKKPTKTQLNYKVGTLIFHVNNIDFLITFIMMLGISK